MNVAFDMSFTSTDSRNRGIGRYARNLIDSIVRRNPNHSYFYFDPAAGEDADAFQNRLQKFLVEHRIDVFHILSPFERNRPPFQKEWFGQTRVAVTLHDVIPLLFPEAYLNRDDEKIAFQRTLSFVKSCDLVMANSETTKRDAIRRAGIEPDKIAVVPGGIESKFRLVRPDAGILERYGIRKPYVMCTGGTDYRKNVPALIAAFGKANRERDFGRQLVIVCRLTQEEKDQLLFLAEAAGTAEDLVLTGFVPDNDLVVLYNGAEVFAFPSLYEGFGFPVLEAMACGVPVLTSNNSSLDEITGDAAFKVAPSSTEDIRKGLLALWSNESVRNELRSKALKRVRHFSWKEAGEKAIQAYLHAGRKKLAIFTPLPPLKTGVADYMDALLPSLSERFECHLYLDDGYEPELAKSVGKNVKVFRHDAFKKNRRQYDAVMYQMGNSRYHAYIVPYLRQYPGIVVLHDLNLHGLTSVWTLSKGDREAYLSVLAEDYGDRASEIMRSVTEGKLRPPYSEITVNSYYLRRAKAIVVHNQYAKNELMKKGFANVSAHGLPVKLPIMISMVFERDFLFSSFGYVSENKHIDLAIRCIRRLIDQGYADIRYSVVGEREPGYAKQLEALVQSLHLQDVVQFHGYVEKNEYHNRICQADACISLRSPTNGESSGHLLDVLSHGKPAIVSDIDSFRELPDDAVCKIAHDSDVGERLYGAMEKLVQDRELRKSLGRQARAYVAEHHAIDRYADFIKTLIEPAEPSAPPDEGKEQAAADVPAPPEPENPAEPETADDRRTVVLLPNRYRRTRRGKRPAAYFSFNLAELPPDCTVIGAVMHIPAYAKVLRVHRIRSPWSVKSFLRRKPSIRPLPIYKKSARGISRPTVFAWDCTQLVRNWFQDHLNNHGVYVPFASASQKPILLVEVVRHGSSTDSR